MSQAWHTASIPNMRGGWPSLAKIVGDEEPPKRRTNDQMLAALRVAARRGAAIEIKKVA